MLRILMRPTAQLSGSDSWYVGCRSQAAGDKPLTPSPILRSPEGTRRRGREGRGQSRWHTAPSAMTRNERRSRSFITITESQSRLSQSTNPSPRQLMSRRLLPQKLLSQRLLFRTLRANSCCCMVCHMACGFSCLSWRAWDRKLVKNRCRWTVGGGYFPIRIQDMIAHYFMLVPLIHIRLCSVQIDSARNRVTNHPASFVLSLVLCPLRRVQTRQEKARRSLFLMTRASCIVSYQPDSRWHVVSGRVCGRLELPLRVFRQESRH